MGQYFLGQEPHPCAARLYRSWRATSKGVVYISVRRDCKKYIFVSRTEKTYMFRNTYANPIAFRKQKQTKQHIPKTPNIVDEVSRVRIRFGFCVYIYDPGL